jgi:hypothetical protein
MFISKAKTVAANKSAAKSEPAPRKESAHRQFTCLWQRVVAIGRPLRPYIGAKSASLLEYYK